jgi:hypothetical protein
LTIDTNEDGPVSYLNKDSFDQSNFDKEITESALDGNINEIKVNLVSEDNENEDEPVIYTLDLTQHEDTLNDKENSLEHDLQYLINESGSLIISTNDIT